MPRCDVVAHIDADIVRPLIVGPAVQDYEVLGPLIILLLILLSGSDVVTLREGGIRERPLIVSSFQVLTNQSSVLAIVVIILNNHIEPLVWGQGNRLAKNFFYVNLESPKNHPSGVLIAPCQLVGLLNALGIELSFIGVLPQKDRECLLAAALLEAVPNLLGGGISLPTRPGVRN